MNEQEQEPNYFKKFNHHCSDIDNEQQFLAFLEDLNQLDWENLIKDISLEKPWPDIIKKYRSDISTIAYYALFFKKLPSTAKRLLNSALNDHVYKYFTMTVTEERIKIVKSILNLCYYLRSGVNKEFLANAFVINQKATEDLRILAAKAIAHYYEPMPVDFWTKEIDIKTYPYLTHIRIQALEELDPLKALETYKNVKERPEDLNSFDFPTIQSIRNIMKNSDNINNFSHLMEHDDFPKWAKEYIDNILKMNEFKRIHDKKQRRVKKLKVEKKFSACLIHEKAVSQKFSCPNPSTKRLHSAYMQLIKEAYEM